MAPSDVSSKVEASWTPPPRGSRREEANCRAEGRVRFLELEEVRARWRSWRLWEHTHTHTHTHTKEITSADSGTGV